MKRTLYVLLAIVLAAAVSATVLTIPASAELQRVTVRMPDGTFQVVVLDVPSGASLQDIRTLVPTGEPVAMTPVQAESNDSIDPPPPPADPQPPTPTPQDPADQPTVHNGQRQQDAARDEQNAKAKQRKSVKRRKPKPRPKVEP